MTAPQLTRYIQGQASVSADNLNTFEQTCSNIGQLRLLIGTDGMQVYVRGFSSPGDGGQGPFYWAPNGFGPDNGTTIIVPAGAGTGVWVRLPTVVATNGSFPTTAALLAAFNSGVILPDGTVYITAGRDTVGDGGGGPFYYNAANTTSADDGGTIRVDGAGRRWIAEIGSALINVALFGAFPSSPDNSAAINAALTAAANTWTRDIQMQGGNYSCLRTLTFDISRTSLDLNACTLDFTNLVDPVAIKPFTTWNDPNSQNQHHNAHPVRNGKILGPSGAKICIQPIPLVVTGVPFLAGCIYEKLGITGFQVFFDLGDGQPFLCLRDISFGSVTGIQSGWFFRNSSTNNSGENVVFDHCFAINCVGMILDSSGSPNIDIYCLSCSADGITYILTGGTVTAPGTVGAQTRVVWLGGHWEPNTFTAYLIWTAIAGSFTGYGVTFVINTIGGSHVPFRSDGASVCPGILLDKIDLYAVSSWAGLVCDGTGNFQISGYGNGNSFMTNAAYANNRVSENNFPNLSSVQDCWGGTPIWDTTDPPPGAVGCMLLNAANSHADFATLCVPGQQAAMACQLKLTGMGAGDTFRVWIRYYGPNNAVLGNNLQSLTANIPAYQFYSLSIQILAPPGTVRVILSFDYFPSAGGASCRIGLPYVIIG